MNELISKESEITKKLASTENKVQDISERINKIKKAKEELSRV